LPQPTVAEAVNHLRRAPNHLFEESPHCFHRISKPFVIIADRPESWFLNHRAPRRNRAYLWSKSAPAIIDRVEVA
jgi:hypothetical protein